MSSHTSVLEQKDDKDQGTMWWMYFSAFHTFLEKPAYQCFAPFPSVVLWAILWNFTKDITLQEKNIIWKVAIYKIVIKEMLTILPNPLKMLNMFVLFFISVS